MRQRNGGHDNRQRVCHREWLHHVVSAHHIGHLRRRSAVGLHGGERRRGTASIRARQRGPDRHSQRLHWHDGGNLSQLGDRQRDGSDRDLRCGRGTAYGGIQVTTSLTIKGDV